MTLSAQLSTNTMIAITNLSEKPIRYIVAFSGGKDSVAMVLHLLKTGVDKSQIELHHHEVDGRGEKLFDWSCTTSYCRAFAEAMALPLYFSYRKGGILREMFRKFPMRLRTQPRCKQSFKRLMRNFFRYFSFYGYV